MRLIYVNSSKVTKLEQKMNNSESFLLLLKNLLKCTYEVLLPSQRSVKDEGHNHAPLFYIHSSSVLWDDSLKDHCDPYLV